MVKNARIVLKKHTAPDERPTEDNFAYEQCPMPEPLKAGQVLIRNLYLSMDATQRFSMNEANVPTYQVPWKVGSVVYGIHGLGTVVKSDSPQLSEGDTVTQLIQACSSEFSGKKATCQLKWPWQLFFNDDATNLIKIDTNLTADGKITHWLNAFGVVGLTAIMGIHEKGHIVPGTNQTFVVSAAAGGCGYLAGQIARLKGCGKVVGICGSDEKCKFLTELKFDVAINYKTQDVESELRKACPEGVDIYFDNVGGEISRIVVEQMNTGSHIILSGQISQYDRGITVPFPIPPEIRQILKDRSITRDAYTFIMYRDTHEKCIRQMAQWIDEGKLIVKECVEEGLENAPRGLLKLLYGGNIGKQIVHVNPQ